MNAMVDPAALEVQPLSISELNRLSRLALEKEIGSTWVTGEISNLSRPASGHLYFSLKDSQSQIRCALFKGHRPAIKIENGQQVVVFANIGLYEPRGDYQLIIKKIKIAGDGLLQIKFNQLKKKLFSEGLFANDKKRAIPTFPKKCGIITSATGAAIKDILKVLKRRFPLCPIKLYPCLVQGATAADAINKMLAQANDDNCCDVLILSRGGGSLEDLWCFNEESVARAIFASNIPIITGIGHEIDTTIADFVADARAATPSAAAELASPDQQECYHNLSSSKQRMLLLIQQRINTYQQQLTNCKKRLRHPTDKIKQHQQTLDQLQLRLNSMQRQVLKNKRLSLISIIRNLNNLNPLNTLERGFCITFDNNNQLILSADQLSIDKPITLRYHRSEALVNLSKIQIKQKVAEKFD